MAQLMSVAAETPDSPHVLEACSVEQAPEINAPFTSSFAPAAPQPPRDVRSATVSGVLARLVQQLPAPVQEALLHRVGVDDLHTLELRINSATDRCFATAPAWHVRAQPEQGAAIEAQQEDAAEPDEGCA